LSRLVGNDESDGQFTNQDRMSLKLINDRIYRHKVLRVNYTTYNVRRDQDSLNPRTHADVMVLSRDDTHPYWYARIVGIFHAMALQTGPKSKSRDPEKMEFLFVRWFGLDYDEVGGWKTKKLHEIGFVGGDEAFGFINPADIIRGVHLIPRFSLGRTKQLLGPSFARSVVEKDEDWVRYCVNMYVVDYFILFKLKFLPRFVDRDMMMRFRGGGVGHLSTRAATDTFKDDRDGLDIKSQQARREPGTSSHQNVDDPEDNGVDDNDSEMNAENSDGDLERDIEGVDEDGQLSDSELFDYGYEPESESESDEEARGEDDEWEACEEDDHTTGVEDYGDY
jgi:hypothetical protein